MFQVKKEDVQKVIHQIVKAVAPQKVIVFGSTARGDFKQNSDLDLLIVMPNSRASKQSKLKQTAKVSRALSQFLFPIDLLLYTQEEYDYWKTSKYHIVHKALKEGDVVYEKF